MIIKVHPQVWFLLLYFCFLLVFVQFSVWWHATGLFIPDWLFGLLSSYNVYWTFFIIVRCCCDPVNVFHSRKGLKISSSTSPEKKHRQIFTVYFILSEASGCVLIFHYNKVSLIALLNVSYLTKAFLNISIC